MTILSETDIDAALADREVREMTTAAPAAAVTTTETTTTAPAAEVSTTTGTNRLSLRERTTARFSNPSLVWMPIVLGLIGLLIGGVYGKHFEHSVRWHWAFVLGSAGVLLGFLLALLRSLEWEDAE